MPGGRCPCHHGGEIITQSYVTRLFNNFPGLKATWDTEVDRRAAAALAKRDADRIRTQIQQDGRKGARSGLQSAISVQSRRVKIEQRREEVEVQRAGVSSAVLAANGTEGEPVLLSDTE